MKLPITDWQKAANARVLIGTVTALDPGANTATITIATGSVAAVPIHYWCNHGADNHAAARVFRVGDEVTALYTGNGDTPSALNMVVMGLKDEIRRCQVMDGLIATFDDGAQWNFKSIAAELIPGGTTTCGNNWWSNGLRTISWSMGASCRYAAGSVAGGPDIYMDGLVIARFGSTFNGAALKFEGDSIWAYVFNQGGLYRKLVGYGGPTENWEYLGSVTGGAISAAASFNASCTKLCYMSDSTQTAYEVNFAWGLSIETIATPYQSGATVETGYLVRIPVAIDYKVDTLCLASYEYEVLAYQPTDITSSSQVFIDGVSFDYYLATVVYHGEFDHIHRILWTGMTHTIGRYKTQTDRTIERYTRSLSPDGYFNTESSVNSESVHLIDTKSIILHFDMRDDCIITYDIDMSGIGNSYTATRTFTDLEATISAVSYSYIGKYGNLDKAYWPAGIEDDTQTTTHNPAAFTTKRMNGIDTLKSVDHSVINYPSSIVITSPRVEYFDLFLWSTSNAQTETDLSFVEWPKKALSSEWGTDPKLKHPLYYLGYDATPIRHIKHPVYADEMTYEKLSATEDYLHYSGGDVATLTGKTPPLRLSNLRVA